MKELSYQFRRRLEEVHKRGRRNPDLKPKKHEAEVSDEWTIVIAANASPYMQGIAKDLQDYFWVSMGVSLRLRCRDSLPNSTQTAEKAIIVATKEELPELGAALSEARSYRIVAEQQKIIVAGYDERGAGQGSYYLEDLMNLREAPYIAECDQVRKPLFSPRMVHSGWGMDLYPDAHLNAMAHAGIDAILLFVKDVDETPEGVRDFNYLIDRADHYGIDVYMYSYLLSRKHPEEDGAEEYYNRTYGKIMEACPRFKGVIFVGESCEFPSRDERTTGVPHTEWPKDQPRSKPYPGWWPCRDYPQWLNMLKKVIRKHNEQAEIIFWTYNWGWAPEENRLELIRSLPWDVTLLVTFEMFEQRKREGVTHVCVDYTASFEGPGQYFASEAKAAHERGIKLYTMSNTGGLTWDIGVIPYEPIPYQWARRHAALHDARERWSLSGLMESHHYGWWPSYISDMTKWSYWSGGPPKERLFEAIAARDFSRQAVQHVLEAWRCWSEGIRHYIPTNEDQYGPFRVGPSYPLVFRNRIEMPDKKHSLFGNRIVMTDYIPRESARQSLGIQRIDVEMNSLGKMLELWQQGNNVLQRAIALTPVHKREEGERQWNMNAFIVCCIQTTIHVKQWWKLKQQLFREPDRTAALSLLEQLHELGEKEIANASAAIPLVERDSRLGWEPSMDYMTDRAHLEWKLAQVRTVLEHELVEYRSSLLLE
ncbi:hypothetical protein M6D81_26200 [Paenibacillus sp. J5C_2022]|uniref:hypothetical protein n=1 Tax=Paenibacillus sp. J5C2022 TaxID=2977129 RepID=UPI0021CF2C34|nr:hypothetical protein [Paenibacillus sp. J5C2022]MCU6712197.1 hypothetical protein [Paenibacillus sp. J5C2022]